MNDLCPFCEQCNLDPIIYSDAFKFDGQEMVIDGLVGHECPCCGEIMVKLEDLRKNQDTIQAARKAKSGD